jgi:hypothetical protein
MVKGRFLGIATLVLAAGIIIWLLIGSLPMNQSKPILPFGELPIQNHPFEETIGSWGMAGDVEIYRTRVYKLTFNLFDYSGDWVSPGPKPTVQVQLNDQTLPAAPLVEEVDRGRFRVIGFLAMPGRWRFRITAGGDRVDIVFDVKG